LRGALLAARDAADPKPSTSPYAPMMYSTPAPRTVNSTARGMARCGARASRPSDAELSKPTNAPTASTVPRAMPVAFDPDAFSWLVSTRAPKCTNSATSRTPIAISEMISRVTETRAEIRTPRMGVATVRSRKTTSRPSCQGLLSAWTPSLTRKAPKYSAVPARQAAAIPR
jgi:hypothetical protein